MNYFNRFFIFLPALICCLPSLSAQQKPQRYSEEEVTTQATFLEARREMLLDKNESALNLLQEVVKKDKQNDAAYYEMARIYNTLKDYEKSIASAKQAIAIDPKNKWYKSLLADLYEKTDQDKEAAEIYKQLVATEAFDEDLYFHWANLLLRAGDPEKSLKVYNELEKRIGVNEVVVKHKHTIYMAMGDSKKAGKELVKLCNAYPENVQYLRLLAEFYDLTGDKIASKEAWQKILALDPNDAAANLAVLNSQKAGSNDVNYLNSLKPLFQKPDVNIDAKVKELIPYVQKIAETGDQNLASVAIELAQILVKTHPNEAKSYALYGDLLYYSGKKTEALLQYQETLKRNKNVYQVWEQILYIYQEQRKFDELLSTSEQTIDLFPNQGTAYYFNGLALKEKGKYDDARPVLDQALMMSSKNPLLKLNTLGLLALIAYKKADYPKAKSWLNQAMQNGGEQRPDLLEWMGDVLYQSGETDNAVLYWQKAKSKGAQSPLLDKKIADKKLYE